MFNARAYKKKQQLYWDEIAPAFDGGLSALMVSLHTRLLDELGIKPGDRVLNVGSGTGMDSFLAAELTGPAGSVVGIDISPEMVRLARAKAEARGLDNVSFEVMDAERLDLADASFDVVLSQWTLMYVPDDHSALSEAYRVLKPGGRLAVGVVGRSENSPFVMLPLRIVTRHLPTVLVNEGGPPTFRFGPEGALETALRRAGFSDCWIGRYATMITTHDADTYWELFMSSVASFAYRFKREAPETQAPIVAEIKQAVAQNATADGIRLQLEWVLGTCRKPAASGHVTQRDGARVADLAQLVNLARREAPAAGPAEALRAQAAGLLLDVRQHQEYAAGHIPGARHVPRGRIEEFAVDELADTRLEIVCYCDTGERSSLAARALRELGFGRASWLRGGIAAWPVEAGTAGPSGAPRERPAGSAEVVA